MKRISRRLLPAVVMAGLCLAGAARALRLAWTDHLSTGAADDRQRAAALEPESPVFQERLAEQLEAENHPARVPLERAARLDPAASDRWVAAALRAELAGDTAAAEAGLLRAAATSRLYPPRWSLAQYYARHQREAEFWRWTRAALETAPGDVRPLLALSWRMRPEARWILDRVIPPRRPVRSAYLLFLLENDAGEDAGRLAGELGSSRPPDAAGTAAVLAYCDDRLAAADASRAMASWNALCRAGAVPHSPLDPDAPALVNPSFSSPPQGRGFDWRPAPPPGVLLTRVRGGALLTFSGRQPEHCRILSQYLALAAGRSYRLHYRHEGPAEGRAALAWAFADSRGRPLPASPVGGEGTVEFRSTGPLALLTLEHRRRSGTTRFEGVVEVSGLRLEALP